MIEKSPAFELSDARHMNEVTRHGFAWKCSPVREQDPISLAREKHCSRRASTASTYDNDLIHLPPLNPGFAAGPTKQAVKTSSEELPMLESVKFRGQTQSWSLEKLKNKGLTPLSAAPSW